MDAKEYLEGVRKSNDRVNDLLSEIERLEDLSKNLSSKPFDHEKISSSGDKDRVATITARLMDKKNKLEKMIDENEEKRDVIISQIYSLEDEKFSRVLSLIYIQDKPYKYIAEELNYNYDHVRKLHRKALRAFENTCMLP